MGSACVAPKRFGGLVSPSCTEGASRGSVVVCLQSVARVRGLGPASSRRGVRSGWRSRQCLHGRSQSLEATCRPPPIGLRSQESSGRVRVSLRVLRGPGQPFLHRGCVPNERRALLAGRGVISGARASFFEKGSAFRVAESAVPASPEPRPGGFLLVSSDRSCVRRRCRRHACVSSADRARSGLALS
jgi:hypothetical protein